MAIEPDRREIIYYELNQLLMVEPDQFPHYWSTLRDKFDIINDVDVLPFCKTCMKYSTVFEFKNRLYCMNEHMPEMDDDGEIIGVEKKGEKEHQLIAGTSGDIIDLVIDFILDSLVDDTDYRMSLFDLEVAMSGIDNNGYFETRDYGDLNKLQIIKHFYYIKRIIVERLRSISQDIYFSSQMKTTPVRL